MASFTVVGGAAPSPLKCPPSGIAKRAIQRGPTLWFWGPTPKRFHVWRTTTPINSGIV